MAVVDGLVCALFSSLESERELFVFLRGGRNPKCRGVELGARAGHGRFDSSQSGTRKCLNSPAPGE
jgi:hypothetical protein